MGNICNWMSYTHWYKWEYEKLIKNMNCMLQLYSMVICYGSVQIHLTQAGSKDNVFGMSEHKLFGPK